MSVNQTKKGNFLIAWDSIYRIEESVFSTELIPELTYYVEGNEGSRKTVSELCVTNNHTSVHTSNVAILYETYYVNS